MEFFEICQLAMRKHCISQNELAKRIGLRKEHLSSVIHRRRNLPAAAAIELAELAELPARQVRDAGKRTGAGLVTGAANVLRVLVLIVALPCMIAGSVSGQSETSRFQKW